MIKLTFHFYDLHVHTFFSDGQWDFDTVLRILIKNGIKIVGFADHIFPGSLYNHDTWGLANTYSADKLRYRKGYIRWLDKKYPEIRILNAGEIDCLPDGRLSLPRGITRDFFDYILVSKHHTFPKNLDLWKKFPKLEKWMWKHNPNLRLMRLMYKKGIQATFSKFRPDVFAHCQENLPKHMSMADMKWFILTAKKYNVAIELNHFNRKPYFPLLTLGKKYGVKFSLGSDFHGFTRDIDEITEQLNHSQEMYELAQDYGLQLLDPHKFLPPDPAKN